MSGDRLSTSRAAQTLRAFLGGLAVAGAAPFFFHRLDLACGGTNAVPGFALSVMLLGWGVGILCLGELRRPFDSAQGRPEAHEGPLGRWARPILAVLTLALWAAALFAVPIGVALPLAILGGLGWAALGSLCALSVEGAAQGRLAFLAGAAMGLAAVAAGLPARVGNGPILMLFVVLGACGGLIGPSQPTAPAGVAASPAEPDSPGAWLSRAFLLAAAGSVGVALLRTYSYSTGWFLYAGADLGLAFCIGMGVWRILFGARASVSPLSLAACALVLLAAAALLESSFFLYPDLIFSEWAVLQSPRVWLGLERVFPILVLSAAVGAVVGATELPTRRGGIRLNDALASGLGAVPAFLISGVFLQTPAGNYIWSAVLCMGALVVIYASSRRRAELGRALAIAMGALAVAGTAWVAWAGFHFDGRFLRSSFAWYLRNIPGRFNYAPPSSGEGPAAAAEVAVKSVRFTETGLTAEVEGRGEKGRFMGGDLVWSSRAPDSAPARLAVALALVFTDVQRVGVLEPALPETQLTGTVPLAGDGRPAGARASGLEVILCEDRKSVV